MSMECTEEFVDERMCAPDNCYLGKINRWGIQATQYNADCDKHQAGGIKV